MSTVSDSRKILLTGCEQIFERSRNASNENSDKMQVQ